ncbi:diamine acetyltransferase 1-like [Haemaphysalis longicornis]
MAAAPTASSSKEVTASKGTVREESAVRPAELKDCPTVLRLVHALANFHKMADMVNINLEQLEHAMFKSQQPKLWAFLATVRRRDAGGTLVSAEEAVVGLITFHYRYSAALGGRILYMEDLFVSEEYRGRGLGVGLLRAACDQALKNKCAALQFRVHKDNESARRVYFKYGAADLSEAKQIRLFYFDKNSCFPPRDADAAAD